MSQFLTNIINRHSAGANIVRPRTKSVFEKKESFTGANSTSFGGDENDSNQISSIGQMRSLSNQEDQTQSGVTSKVNRSVKQENDIPQQNNSRNTENVSRIIGPKKRQVTSNPRRNSSVKAKKEEISTRLKGQNSQQIEQPLSISNKDKNEKVDLNKISNVSKILEKPENVFNEIKTANQFEKALSKEIDVPFQIEKTPINFNKETHQNLITNLNLRNFNGIAAQVKDSNSTNENNAPTIKIQIGRIDIKAIKQNPIKQLNTRKQEKSGNSLEQFLKKRENK